MADGSLEYDLRLRLSKAKKDVDVFVKDTEKKLDDATKGKKFSRSEQTRGIRELKDRSKELEKAKKAEGGLFDTIRNNVEVDKKRAQAARDAAKADEEAAKAIREKADQLERETNLKQKSAAAEQRRRNAEKDSAKALNAQKKRAEDAQKEADRVFQQQQNREFQGHKKRMRDEQAFHNFVQARESEATRFEIQRGQVSIEARRQWEIGKTQIAARYGQERTEVLERELREQLQIYRTQSKLTAPTDNERRAQEQARQNALSKRANRLTLRGFQIQQAIEDYQFAGIRGAANNIALLAASFGGPGGLAAMAGLATYSLVQVFKTMSQGEEEVKSLAEKVRDLTDAYIEKVEARRKGFEQGREFDPLRSTAEQRQKLADSGLDRRHLKIRRDERAEIAATLKALENLDKAYRELDAAHRALYSAGPGGVSDSLIKGVQRAQAQLAAARDAVRGSDRARELGVDVADRVAVKESIKNLREEVDTRDEEIQKTQKQVELEKALIDVYWRKRQLIDRINSSDTPEIGDLFGGAEDSKEVAESYQATAKALTDAFEARKDSQKSRLESTLEALNARFGETEERSKDRLQVENEIHKVLEDHAKLAERENGAYVVRINLSRTYHSMLGSAQQMIEARVEAAQDEIVAIDRSIEGERKRLEILKQQRQEIKDQIKDTRNEFSSTKFDLERDIAKTDLEEQEKRAMESVKKRIQREAQRKFGTLDSKERSLVNDVTSREEEKIKQRFEALGRKSDEALVVGRRKELEARIAAEERAAEAAQKGGDTETARQRVNDQIEALQELEQFEISAAQSGTADQKRAALEKVAAITENVVAAHQKLEQLNQVEQQRAQGNIHHLKEAKGAIHELITSAQQLDIWKPGDLVKGTGILFLLQMQVKAAERLRQLSDDGKGIKKVFGIPIPGKAKGGPVDKDKPYVVGEKGPELFVPHGKGKILPAAKTKHIVGERRRRQMELNRKRLAEKGLPLPLPVGEKFRTPAPKKQGPRQAVAVRGSSRKIQMALNRERNPISHALKNPAATVRSLITSAQTKKSVAAQRESAIQTMAKFSAANAAEKAALAERVKNRMEAFGAQRAAERAAAAARSRAQIAKMRAQMFLGLNLPKKAAGGLVGRGRPYVVGERGPELFIPTVNRGNMPIAEAQKVRAAVGVGGQRSAGGRPSVSSVATTNNHFGGIDVTIVGNSLEEMRQTLIQEAKNSAIRTG